MNRMARIVPDPNRTYAGTRTAVQLCGSHLHKKDDGFGTSNGWDLVLWSKELCISNVTALHSCYYIIHRYTGEVITSQFKALNDTVRMIMWIEK